VKILLFFCLLLTSCQADNKKQSIELGTVKWSRDLPATLEASKKSGKPVFLLFQEVPGWAGCRVFGSEVLSHAPLVKLIESEFEAVAIHNNTGGKDAKILKEFKEPSWNYQVVRFIRSDKSDIIPRRSGVNTISGIAARMVATLEKEKRKVPAELRALVKK